MSDLISRQAAIEVADAVWSVTGDKNVVKVWDQIKDLPSAHCDNCPYPSKYVTQEDAVSRKAAIDAVKQLQPAPQWIPVTEHLPRECQTVIASVDTGIYPEARFDDGRWWWAFEAGADYWEEIKKDVTAWMPLPEPYRKGANPP